MTATKERIQRFAKYFYAELEKDHWGDIDPEYFRAVAEGETYEPFGQELGGTESIRNAIRVALELTE
jgi:hypothetical protein